MSASVLPVQRPHAGVVGEDQRKLRAFSNRWQAGGKSGGDGQIDERLELRLGRPVAGRDADIGEDGWR